MFTFIAALAATLAAQPAGITYLDCDDSNTPFLITINEPAGTVSIKNKRGWHIERATFSEDSVYFDGDRVSRVDLNYYHDDFKIMQCHVVKKRVNRAF